MLLYHVAVFVGSKKSCNHRLIIEYRKNSHFVVVAKFIVAAELSRVSCFVNELQILRSYRLYDFSFALEINSVAEDRCGVRAIPCTHCVVALAVYCAIAHRDSKIVMTFCVTCQLPFNYMLIIF